MTKKTLIYHFYVNVDAVIPTGNTVISTGKLPFIGDISWLYLRQLTENSTAFGFHGNDATTKGLNYCKQTASMWFVCLVLCTKPHGLLATSASFLY
jgi:hypothetical protein